MIEMKVQVCQMFHFRVDGAGDFHILELNRRKCRNFLRIGRTSLMDGPINTISYGQAPQERVLPTYLRLCPHVGR